MCLNGFYRFSINLLIAIKPSEMASAMSQVTLLTSLLKRVDCLSSILATGIFHNSCHPIVFSFSIRASSLPNGGLSCLAA